MGVAAGVADVGACSLGVMCFGASRFLDFEWSFRDRRFTKPKGGPAALYVNSVTPYYSACQVGIYGELQAVGAGLSTGIMSDRTTKGPPLLRPIVGVWASLIQVWLMGPCQTTFSYPDVVKTNAEGHMISQRVKGLSPRTLIYRLRPTVADTEALLR